MIDLLLDNLGLVIEADGDGKRIRGAILQLAVRGQLMAQEAGDEDAQTLLLAAERDRDARVALGELRKERRTFLEGAPPIKASDRRGWISAGLGSIAYIEMGQSPKSDTYNDKEIGLPFFQGKAEFGEDHPRAVQWCSDPKKVAEVGDVLVSVRAPVGPTNLADERCCVGRGLAAVRALAGMPPRFLRLLIQAGEPRLVAAATGTTFVAIGRDDLFNLVCDLPPLAEQHRIVAKVDELMEHASAVEEHHLAASSARVRFRDAALHALAEAEDHEAVERAWSRIEENFDDLFTEPEDIQPLRQSILQLAIRGRLVAQEAGDEDARSIPSLVDTEKVRRFEAGTGPKPKKSKNSTVEPDFDVPSGWAWLRLSEALVKITDGTHHSPPNGADGEYLYITAKNIKSDGVRIDNATRVSRDVHNEIYARCDPETGDVLYIKDGATTGVVTVNQLIEPFSMLSSVALLKTCGIVSSHFLCLAMRSNYYYEQMRGQMAGMAITRVTLKKLNESKIPVPPLAEQQRIVAKVDELMALCDTLEKSLERSKKAREQFANSISSAIAAPTAALT